MQSKKKTEVNIHADAHYFIADIAASRMEAKESNNLMLDVILNTAKKMKRVFGMTFAN